jgi:hypothetical protein
MSTKSRLISGRVPVTSAANVAANRYQYLDLSSAEPNLGTGNTGDVLVYDSTFPGGRKWTAQADIRGSIGEAAYVEANTASANTLYLSGVDVAQNNRLTAVETNAQAAFNAANTKLSTSGGTITGSLNVSQDLAVTGNLTVLGTTTTINTASFTVVDSLITLGVGNYTSDLLDIGISGHYNDGTNAHTGIIRDPGTKEWYVFEGYTPTVDANNNININDASFAKANVNADYFKGNVAFPDGTTQTTAATGIDSYARTTANTATDNITVLQGVNTTQNTNITTANNAAQAAFAQANATAGGLITANANITIIEGVNTTQNTRIGIIEGVNTTQNNDITIIQGVDTAQNTRITIAEGVDVGQNTRMSIIEGVDTTQNTNITIATNAATAAFAQANATAGGLITANARITVAEGVDLAQNTRITNVDTKAQAAFDKANTGFNSSGGTITGDTVVTGNLTVTGTQFYANTVNLAVVDNIITLNSNVTGAPSLSAGIEVNRGSSTNTKLLWSEANTAWEFTNNGTTYDKIAGLTYVQAAFDKANTAEGSVGFLAFDKANSANVLAQSAFDKANSAAAAANSAGSVLTSTVDTFTGDGSTVAYTLSTTPATINYTTAVVGGVTQPRSAYSVIGTTLTFTSAPANTQIIEVTTIGTSNTTLYTVNNIISPFLLMGA